MNTENILLACPKKEENEDTIKYIERVQEYFFTFYNVFMTDNSALEESSKFERREKLKKSLKFQTLSNMQDYVTENTFKVLTLEEITYYCKNVLNDELDKYKNSINRLNITSFGNSAHIINKLEESELKDNLKNKLMEAFELYKRK